MGLTLETEEMFRDGMGDPVIYKQKGKEPVETTAIIRRSPFRQERTANGEYQIKEVRLLIDLSSISKIVIDEDTVEFDGKEWAVYGEEKISQSTYSLDVVRREVIKKKARR